jgi:hypothetical protein
MFIKLYQHTNHTREYELSVHPKFLPVHSLGCPKTIVFLDQFSGTPKLEYPGPAPGAVHRIASIAVSLIASLKDHENDKIPTADPSRQSNGE